MLKQKILFFDNENGKVDDILAKDVSRNGTHLEQGKNLTIKSITGMDINRQSPNAALDIECDFPNKTWENVRIGTIVSKNTSGIKFQPGYMRESTQPSTISILVNRIEIFDRGDFKFRAIKNDLIDGYMQVNEIITYNCAPSCIYLENSNDSTTKIIINSIDIRNNRGVDVIENDYAMYISKGGEFGVDKGTGNIDIKNVRYSGNNSYILRSNPVTSAVHNTSIENLVSNIPIRTDTLTGGVLRGCDISLNTNLLQTKYNKGSLWMTYHMIGTHYHNEGATSSYNITISNNDFKLKNTNITLENRTDNMYIGFDFTSSTNIHPKSLNFIRGFRSKELGSKIVFKQDSNGNIIIIEKIGNWESI